MSLLVSGSAIVLPVLYTLLLVAYAQRFLGRRGGLVRTVRGMLFATVSIHAGTIALRAAIERACPVTAQAEIFSLVAFTVLTIYVTLEGRFDRGADADGEDELPRTAGVFVVATAFVMQLIASLLSIESVEPARSLAFWPSLHVFTGVISISAVAVASVYGVLYLFLYRSLKRGSFGLFYQRMPDLESLGRVNFFAVIIAFAAVSVTIAGGAASYFAMEDVEVSRWRVGFTVALWMLYGGLIIAHAWFRFGGKRLAYSTVLGAVFAFSILAVGLVRMAAAS
ncbi:MAG: hypothetical protein AAF488_04495 [Planctomycetota bacterium]